MPHPRTTPSARRTLAVAVAVASATCALAAPSAHSRGTEPARGHRAATTIIENRLPFTTRFQGEFHGSVTHIGNALMTCDETKPPVDPAQPPCEQARTGAGTRPINNNYEMKYVNIDPGSIGPLGDPIYSASSADLSLPPGATVKYARLYWGGTRGIGDTVLPESRIDEIYLKFPGDADYTNIANQQPSIGYITTDEESSYQASADITDLVRSHGTGTYTGANMDSVVKPHSWGGWSIAIAYEDPCAPLRHVHLWDGFQPELPNSPALSGTLNGIRTPATGPVTGHLGWVVYDGDHKWTGDTLDVKSTNGPLTRFTDADHPADDAFNSTVGAPGSSGTFARNPAPRNNFGYDTNRWNVSPFLRNGDTSITVTVNTQGDGYDLGVFYADIDLDESVFAANSSTPAASAWNEAK
ncbi:hypothetical protein OG401_39380 [Kitasatospora purpeofusca]|uniref:hypothetical protein n=1 Tax=Kitasatospora purpeofusca TaxID=67352 RepID=UPI0022515CDB|nr:hypothetical protein [Kitasatospora purpeofusca]MCX4690285.1 hypothetical protein [Kitasatospora purpeofusca]